MKAIQSIRKIPFEYDYIILSWSMKKDTVNVFFIISCYKRALTWMSIIIASAVLYHSLSKFSISAEGVFIRGNPGQQGAKCCKILLIIWGAEHTLEDF